MNLKIKSVTVSTSSRRSLNGNGSQDNFSSFSMEKEDGEGFTPEEAVLVKMRMTRNVRRMVLLDELAQGLISKAHYEDLRDQMESRYAKILKKLDQDPGCLLRELEGDEECSPKT